MSRRTTRIRSARRLTLELLEGRDVPSGGPVANDDFVTAHGSVPATIDVLRNDQPAASLVPGSVRFVAAPARGTASINAATGQVTYTAAGTFQGTDSFDYTVATTAGLVSAPGHVTIVVNRPTANDDVADTDGTNPVTIDVVANDSDPDGQTNLNPASVQLAGRVAAHGRVSVNPTSGLVSYVADAGYGGSDSFGYTVGNNDGAISNVGTITVVVNRPTAVDDFAATTIGNSVTINLLANDTDPDGDEEINPASVRIVGTPTHGTVSVSGSGSATFTPGAGFAGVATFQYTITDFPGAESNVATVRINVDYPKANRLIAVGADAGGSPLVVVYGADGAVRGGFLAYDATFTGGVRVAIADVDGDLRPDIITAAGFGGAPHIKVFSGTTLQPIRDFFAYGTSFRGGAWVAAGDVNGDGFADIITGAGAGGGPHVKVFDGRNLTELQSFFAYGATFTGGVTVAAGDVTGDGLADVVTGAGAGGGPHVKVFNGNSGVLAQSFFAYDASFRGGVTVAAGYVDGSGIANIVTGAGVGGAAHVKLFDGGDDSLIRSTFAFDPSLRGGVKVGVGDINGDGLADLLAASGPGSPAHALVLDGQNFGVLADLTNLGAFNGGVYVGGH